MTSDERDITGYQHMLYVERDSGFLQLFCKVLKFNVMQLTTVFIIDWSGDYFSQFID